MITTQLVEEAEILGDRIAIMDKGQVKCYGTPSFLKKMYGMIKKNKSMDFVLNYNFLNIYLLNYDTLKLKRDRLQIDDF